MGKREGFELHGQALEPDAVEENACGGEIKGVVGGLGEEADADLAVAGPCEAFADPGDAGEVAMGIPPSPAEEAGNEESEPEGLPMMDGARGHDRERITEVNQQ